MRKTVAALALALVLVSCGPLGVSEVTFTQAARPPAGSALLYVFHLDAEAALFSPPVVRLDGAQVAVLRAPEYTALHVRAARHAVSLAPEDGRAAARPIEFDLAPGQVAALALAYNRPAQSNPGYTVKSKQGTISLPEIPGAERQFSYGLRFIPDIEANATYADLRQRRFRPAEAAELAAR